MLRLPLPSDLSSRRPDLFPDLFSLLSGPVASFLSKNIVRSFKRKATEAFIDCYHICLVSNHVEQMGVTSLSSGHWSGSPRSGPLGIIIRIKKNMYFPLRISQIGSQYRDGILYSCMFNNVFALSLLMHLIGGMNILVVGCCHITLH